ncbi:SHOCT domain-containing protein [Peptostreptococcus anaerobius]|uniref:SHOCT domain-containing protein n=1 Tax=Peptostreptococcus anaerobius TaxID=1261 RepID=UPI0029168029|nr:SHOCT domain-containing protein [Peptostreptococcus anaerobius]
MEIKIENTALTNVTSRIGLAMNNEFEFYTSYLFFLKLKNERIITNKEFKEITNKLIEKYKAKIVPLSSNLLDLSANSIDI